MRSTILKIIGVVFLLVIVSAAAYYTPDIPVEKLKEKYSYDNSQFTSVLGMDVHYRINGSGPNLLLIHGTAASLHTWEDWTKELENEFRVISVDIPAFGLTGPHPKRTYAIDDYIKFLESFTDVIQLDSFSLVGNSLGGLIAWNYAAQHPEQIDKLILVDPSGLAKGNPASIGFRLAQHPITSKLLLSFTPKSLFEKSLKEVYHDPSKFNAKILDRYYDLGLRPGNRQAFVDRAQMIHKVDTTRLLNITSPTLIMWGRQDAWIPVEHAARYQSMIKNSEVIIYENAGHIPMEEIPNKTVKDVSRFLKN